MPYGKKAIEMREAFKHSKDNKKRIQTLSDYLNILEQNMIKGSRDSTIFDSTNDPEEMCDTTKITKTKVDMNKLRRMKK